MTDALEEVLRHFPSARKNGAGWKAMCPAHADKNPSLAITEKDGKILLHCHAGCSQESVFTAAGLDSGDLVTEPNKKSRIVATYDYHDENGAVLYQTVRYEPKDFRQRHSDGNGGWTWNLNGVRRVLYNLPEVLKSDHVLIVEGEKDVEKARTFGLVGTCNSMGAGKWRDEYSDTLRGKNVTIIPDADEPGRKHAEQVAQSLHLKAASVAICRLPEPIKDLSDYPLSSESLIELIKQAPAWGEAKSPTQSLGSYSTAQLFAVQSVNVEWLCYPFAAIGLTSIIDALPKIGKTRFILEGIKASRSNKPFLSLATKLMRVVYVSEQSAASLAMQAREVGFTGEEPIEELRWITRENWSRFAFTDFLARLENEILKGKNYNCLIFDTWHTSARLEDENAASEVNRQGNLTIDVATRNGLALILGRHDRKSGGDVGLSGRSSIQLSGLVDVILHLVRIAGKDNQRKLELIGRVPNLPSEQLIELVGSEYVNCGVPEARLSNVDQVRAWHKENAAITAAQIVDMFAAQVPSVKVTQRTAQRYLKDVTK